MSCNQEFGEAQMNGKKLLSIQPTTILKEVRVIKLRKLTCTSGV
jgi:hypothetical protein